MYLGIIKNSIINTNLKLSNSIVLICWQKIQKKSKRKENQRYFPKKKEKFSIQLDC